jgi:hypothetical protein
MKKIFIVPLLLSCLGTPSFTRTAAAAAITGQDICFGEAPSAPYFIKEVENIVNIEWDSEEKHLVVTSSDPSYGTRTIPFEDIGFMTDRGEVNVMVYFPSLKEYITRTNTPGGHKKNRKKTTAKQQRKKELDQYIQAILKNFFNNDKSLTHLHSSEKMAFFEAHCCLNRRPVFLLQLPSE